MLGAASFLPGVGAATAMANPDAAAQGLDRMRAGARGRGRRGRGVDASGMNRAFVAELGRLCGRHPWVVLFFDTWEQTGGLLDEWLRDLLEDPSGTLPMNVLVVMAGRGVLAERPWAPLRPHVVDVPLAEFTETETRTLLAARGVTEPGVVDAVLRLSLGLPLLVELLALAEPESAEDVGADADVVDVAVDRFVQWVNDPHDRDAILACALAPRLNEDVFAAAVPHEARGRWGWLCGQPFVSGHGDFKHYHAVVRASMVRQQQAHSPQRWTETHLRLADAHAAWRAAAERDLPRSKLWSDARWLRHRLDETYHRLCAQPACQLAAALEEAVHAAGQDVAVLRQWVDVLQLAAYDTVDAGLLAWARRLDAAVTGDEPQLAALAVLLEHGSLSTEGRGRAHTFRGHTFHAAERYQEAVDELNRAVVLAPRDVGAWGLRGSAHYRLNHFDCAIDDFTTIVGLEPDDHLARYARGALHLRAGHVEEALTDLTATLAADPAHAQALMLRGCANLQADRSEDAVRDLTDALDIGPHSAFAFAERGKAHQRLGRPEDAFADYNSALRLEPTHAGVLIDRGCLHREADRYAEAIADFTSVIESDPTHRFAYVVRGVARFQAGQLAEALQDLDTALVLDATDHLALACRGTVYQHVGRFDDAVGDLTIALDSRPDDISVLTLRGEAHGQAGRHTDAVKDLTAALDLNPSHVEALHLRGIAHRQSGDFAHAREDLAQAVALQGATVDLLFEQAMLDTVESGPES
ncbi:tetratricopeptide repeat protein [Streptomyces spectabilis]|uniref:tetratricopeptide repeat protein n=1 Tax=Streptomyces spectabilis TaxID=68270 RepID=UPI0033EB2E3F